MLCSGVLCPMLTSHFIGKKTLCNKISSHKFLVTPHKSPAPSSLPPSSSCTPLLLLQAFRHWHPERRNMMTIFYSNPRVALSLICPKKGQHMKGFIANHTFLDSWTLADFDSVCQCTAQHCYSRTTCVKPPSI